MPTGEIEIKRRAEQYARKNKVPIAKEITSIANFLPDEFPVSVFMAGSPGAGKTETSRNLIRKFTADRHMVLRIDSDELRTRFVDYTGKNSDLFVGATSIIADKIHDFALENKQSFVFDGTFSNLVRSRENIKRSLKRKRFVQIVYVYQEPQQAWNFVKAREVQDGRKIPRNAFIEQYFAARKNVNLLKKEFKAEIRIDLVVKNIDGTDFNYRENIDVIDSYIPEKYNKSNLENLIN